MKTDLSLRDHQSVFMGVRETKSHIVFLYHLNLTDTPKNWHDAGGCAAGEEESSVKLRIPQAAPTLTQETLRPHTNKKIPQKKIMTSEPYKHRNHSV